MMLVQAHGGLGTQKERASGGKEENVAGMDREWLGARCRGVMCK